MPVDPSDTVQNTAIFPDDAPGDYTVIQALFWAADDEEDREQLPEEAQYGYCMPVYPGVDRRTDELPALSDDAAKWLCAPRVVRDFVDENGLERGDSFRVLSVDRGHADDDPYVMDFEYPFKA